MSQQFFSRTCALALLMLAGGFCSNAIADDVPTGEQIYRQTCAACHGPSGEGTKKHSEPLAGDRALADLAKVIAKRMPEDNPGSLSAEEAQRVAAYIHDAFYSAAARDRNKPPRVELARLTVRQYRNAVTDLVGSFRGQPRLGKQNGLKAEYYKNRRFRNNDRVLERIDPELRFDFGTGGPVGDKTAAHEFSIRWNGSIHAPETGQYEFVIRTEHAVRLWINDMRNPVIDAFVKSGNDTEYRASLFLLGGRTYPLRVEYTKAKQGVDDSKTNKAKPPRVKSSIALEWKLPHRPSEVVPSRYLFPSSGPEMFVVASPFPPDDRSYGWERGTAISREWDQAATQAGLETASYVASRMNELAGTRDKASDRKAKVKTFCRRFAEKAFRRPLSEEQRRFFVDRHFDQPGDVELAVKRVVLLVLKSPRFLYREARAGADNYDVASRLSFGLWDSLPDNELLAAAAERKLATREQVARQAERMLADPRCRVKLRGFLLTWLKVDLHPEIAKDQKRFPEFDEKVVADLRTSLELFLDEVVWDERSDFRRLLLADDLYLNGRLAEHYGADLAEDAGFEKVRLEEGERAGVLTHPYLMSAFAYSGESSPIHRGVFLARGMLGVLLRPPPEAFTPLPADLHPKLTTRERVTLQTREASCMACHGIINPLGFSLENFDAIGRYRDKDNNKPINALGSFQTRSGKKVTFKGARKLAEFLTAHEEVHQAFAEQMFHHLVQQSIKAYGTETPAELRRSFARNNFNMRKLAVEVMVRSASAANRPPHGERGALAP